MSDSKDQKIITLCHTKDCCPTLERQENTVLI